MATLDRPGNAPRISRGGDLDIAERLPPQDLEAEKSVLGSILLDPEVIDEVSLIVRPDDFYAPAHQQLFHHLRELHNAGGRIDVLLLADRLKKANEYESVGGGAYLAELAQVVPVAAHAAFYARIVQHKAMLRSLIHAGTEIIRDAYDPSIEPRELVGKAEERVFGILDDRSATQALPLMDVLHEAMERIDARLNNAHEMRGVPTGFQDLDNMTGGLNESELVILAARPSMGKTALATNIAEHVALRMQTPALFVSLEMSRLELAERMLASYARFDAHKLKGNRFSDGDMQMLVEKNSELCQAKLFVDDTPSRTMSEIAATARRLRRKQGLGLVIIDYLQLIEPDNPKDSRQEQVARIARRLKVLARELSIPIVCLAQLNRQAEVSKDNRPRLSHLRESGAIEQDADVVMFVHREEYYRTQDEARAEDLVGQAELIIAKQRNGPTGDVPLTWRAEFTRFESRAARHFDQGASAYEF